MAGTPWGRVQGLGAGVTGTGGSQEREGLRARPLWEWLLRRRRLILVKALVEAQLRR